MGSNGNNPSETGSVGKRELPILFSPPMTKANLAGIKTETRRLRGLAEINEAPDEWTVQSTDAESAVMLNRVTGELRTLKCPYGPAGTRLWVKEGWRPESCWVPRCTCCGGITITYLADKTTRDIPYEQIPDDWIMPAAARRGGITSLFMPRWASRLTLKSQGWRLERLQEITEEGAKAEGMVDGGCTNCGNSNYPNPCGCDSPSPSVRDSYAHLWGHLNGKNPRTAWAANPWVWVIRYRRVPHPAAAMGGAR